jgi:ATP-dependent helicase/DNAse subunit B
MGHVALTLVIGPANAEKAGAVLDGYRAALGDAEPILVVPTLADVDHYRRELAASGAVFGVEVMTFDWLMREAAKRALVRGRALGRMPRERVAAAAIGRLSLGPLAASAATPGFVPALLDLVGELEEARATPARTTQALRAWAAQEPGRSAYAEDLAALVSAYHRELERLGAKDRRLQHAAALDALRLDPAAWGATPVFFYGFDDLSPLQRDAVETLACHVGAAVTVSLTYEPGRTAFAARARTFEDLRALPGAEVERHEPRSDHYAEHARAALHHLERGLFELDVEPADPGDALLLLEAGGERAEVELVGAHVARLLREEGYAPEDVAVVWRSLAGVAPLVEQVFGAFGIPFAIDRRLPAGHTALGRGLLGLLRAALPDGGVEDLLAYLRTPGVLTNRDLADALEADCRREGERTAAGARAAWEERHFPLDAVRRVAGAAAAGPVALCERLAHEAQVLLTRPHRGTAAILAPEEAVDARVAGDLRRALRELGGLAAKDPRLVPAPAELARVLGAVEVRVGPPPGPGRVAVSEPLAVRARRVRALFACGLQEGVWPKPAAPEPLLGDDERAALARASGLFLRHSEDQLAAERFVFYAAASRPTDLLVLSRRTADDEGRPAVPSFFLADVADLFSPPPRVQRRLLGQVAWPEGLAPTDREARRGAAALAPPRPPAPVRPLRAEPVLAALAARATFSASDLEAWAGCPVRWLVDRLLRPQPLEPDPEPLLRGVLAHDILKDVFAALGEGPLTPGDLPAARAALVASFAARAPGVRISVNPERLRAELRRLEAQLVRYVDHAVTAGSAFGPWRLEHDFEAQLAEGLRLKGRIDRVDADAEGRLLLYDYKGKSATPHARWEADRRLQMGLYLLAAREALGGEAVGGLYQPLGAEDSQPRGLVLVGADPDRNDISGRDEVDEETFEAALADVLRAAAAAAAELRAGALEARPATCAFKGGCEYPSICRCEAA